MIIEYINYKVSREIVNLVKYANCTATDKYSENSEWV